ncbi:MAG: T9SS type A sorting domain-containing protein [Candidatus Delongbacteria bacterium]|nr:T9SS type A sorting domain-containing protein [Candidatus Delongbacteria bacterium]
MYKILIVIFLHTFLLASWQIEKMAVNETAYLGGLLISPNQEKMIYLNIYQLKYIQNENFDDPATIQFMNSMPRSGRQSWSFDSQRVSYDDFRITDDVALFNFSTNFVGWNLDTLQVNADFLFYSPDDNRILYSKDKILKIKNLDSLEEDVLHTASLNHRAIGWAKNSARYIYYVDQDDDQFGSLYIMDTQTEETFFISDMIDASIEYHKSALKRIACFATEDGFRVVFTKGYFSSKLYIYDSSTKTLDSITFDEVNISGLNPISLDNGDNIYVQGIDLSSKVVTSHIFKVNYETLSYDSIISFETNYEGYDISPFAYHQFINENKFYFIGKGDYEYYSAIYCATNDVKVDEIKSPESFMLSQNYPNPFNPTTTISYSLPFEGIVEVTIYNSRGEVVKELLNDIQTSGMHELQFDGSKLSSGVYHYSISLENKNLTGKMLLIK